MSMLEFGLASSVRIILQTRQMIEEIDTLPELDQLERYSSGQPWLLTSIRKQLDERRAQLTQPAWIDFVDMEAHRG